VLVDVILVSGVAVTVVDVVDVTAVRNRDVTAAVTMGVGVFGVFQMARCHGGRLLPRAARRVSSRSAG
jgi:hypothetical protein